MNLTQICLEYKAEKKRMDVFFRLTLVFAPAAVGNEAFVQSFRQKTSKTRQL